MKNTQLATMAAREMTNINLGDARLDVRTRAIVSCIEKNPQAGFPIAMENDSMLKSCYRFLNNDKVSFPKLLSPHQQETWKRIESMDEVLMPHDTTHFLFKGDCERSGLGRINSSDQGFLGHFSIATTLDACPDVLGVVDAKLWTRDRDKLTPRKMLENKEITRKEYLDMPSEMDRWWDQIKRIHDMNQSETKIIHVMDREADDFKLLANMVTSGIHFVVRSCTDRHLVETAGLEGEAARTRAMMNTLPLTGSRIVRINRRGNSGGRKKSKDLGVRDERFAELSCCATSINIKRPEYIESEDYPPSVMLNMVCVTEKNAPAGCEPVSWFLLTSEPIDTPEQIWKIVDIYKCRWVIEEFFKSIKTGCRFEDRQLESIKSLQNALALMCPVAWKLLRLRTMAGSDRQLPATKVLSENEIAVLRDLTVLKLPRNPSVAEALAAVAQIGGHSKYSKLRPGWMVLGRGFLRLLDTAKGYDLAMLQRCVL